MGQSAEHEGGSGRMRAGRTRSGYGNALILFSRALRLRCPACASGGLFDGWFSLKRRCPGCNLLFTRGESGYELGSMAFNLIFAELIWVVGFVAVLFATWPSPPWTLLQWGSIVLMIALPIVLFPFTRTAALALDILFRPIDRDELRRGE
jgi:uncharacterized protein (DUF983 family)